MSAAGSFLPKDTATPVWLGNYDENTWPNPMGTPTANTFTGFTFTTLTFMEEADPSTVPPGDID